MRDIVGLSDFENEIAVASAKEFVNEGYHNLVKISNHFSHRLSDMSVSKRSENLAHLRNRKTNLKKILS